MWSNTESFGEEVAAIEFKENCSTYSFRVQHVVHSTLKMLHLKTFTVV